MFIHSMYRLPTVSKFFASIALLNAARISGNRFRTFSQTTTHSPQFWKNSSSFSTPLVTNEAAISQQPKTMRKIIAALAARRVFAAELLRGRC